MSLIKKDETCRSILHVDMDAFYASVEQADEPSLAGKPVIVGGSTRGVVSTASYEARKFGIRSAMPVFQARRLCPQGIFLPVRMSRYREVSRQVMELLCSISPVVEQVSIDEAFVDLSGLDLIFGAPSLIAAHLKAAVRERTSLTCSVGIAPCRFLAKVASEMNKPDGFMEISQSGVKDLMNSLPVGKLPGVGPRTVDALRLLGVSVAADVLRHPVEFWIKRFGKFGSMLYERACGIDHSPIVPYRNPQSCSAEDTFPEDTEDREVLKAWLLTQAESVGGEIRRDGFRGRTITLKIKLSDFTTLTRSRTLHEPTDSTVQIFGTAVELLDAFRLPGKIRLIGVGISNLTSGPHQQRLFPESGNGCGRNLDRVIDEIRNRFGKDSLLRGRLIEFNPRK